MSDKDVKKINGLIATIFDGLFPALRRLATAMMASGGFYSMVVYPFFALTKTALYWRKIREKSKRNEMVDGKTWAKFFFLHVSKSVVDTTAAVLAIVGIAMGVTPWILIGFGMMTGAGALVTLRNFYKMCENWGDSAKRNKYALNFVIGAMFVIGFTLMTFFPPLYPIGWLMAVGTSGALVIPAVVDLLPKSLFKPVSDLKELANKRVVKAILFGATAAIGACLMVFFPPLAPVGLAMVGMAVMQVAIHVLPRVMNFLFGKTEVSKQEEAKQPLLIAANNTVKTDSPQHQEKKLNKNATLLPGFYNYLERSMEGVANSYATANAGACQKIKRNVYTA